MDRTPTIRFPVPAQQKLVDLGIAAVYLMGSRATGTATPRSDYDFGVILRDSVPLGDDEACARLHQALYDLLTEVVPATDAPPPPGILRDVDIVFLQRAPLYYAIHALKYGHLVYDGEPRARVHFEERACRDVMDFAPLRHALERALLASL